MVFNYIHSNGKLQTPPRKLTLVKAGEEELNFSTTRVGMNSHGRLDSTRSQRKNGRVLVGGQTATL